MLPSDSNLYRDSRIYRRSRRNQRKRVRLLIVICILILIIVYFLWPSSSGGNSPRSSTSTVAGSTTTTLAPMIQAQNLPIVLTVDVSREAVVFDPSLSTSSLILVGGLFASGTTTPNVATVNYTSGAETLLGTMAQPVHDTTAQIEGNSLIVLGGGATSVLASVQLGTFNGLGPNSMSFTQGQGMPQPRADLTSVVHNGQIYVLDGYDGNTMDGAILSTSAGATFNSVGTLSVPIRYGAAVATTNAIYVFGGLNQSGQIVTTIQRYSFRKKNTTIVGNLPVGLAGASVGLLSNNIYLAGGQSANGTSSAIYEFNTKTNQIGNAGTMAIPEAYAGYTVANNNLYIVGGENAGKLTNNIQQLTPNLTLGHVS